MTECVSYIHAADIYSCLILFSNITYISIDLKTTGVSLMSSERSQPTKTSHSWPVGMLFFALLLVA